MQVPTETRGEIFLAQEFRMTWNVMEDLSCKLLLVAMLGFAMYVFQHPSRLFWVSRGSHRSDSEMGTAWTGVPSCIHRGVWPHGEHPKSFVEFWQARYPLVPTDFEPLQYGIHNLPKDFLAASSESSESTEQPWHLRHRFRLYLLNAKWASMTEEEMENLETAFSEEKKRVLEHHIHQEARRTGAMECRVLPSHVQTQASCSGELFNELPDHVLSSILSQLECYDLRCCREVSKRWCNLADGCISRLVCFNYPLSFHVLRHTQWLEENGDFSGGRMLSSWKEESETLLRLLIQRCSNLQTLVVACNISSTLLQHVVKNSPQLRNVCINPVDCGTMGDLHPINLTRELGENNCNSSLLRVVSLAVSDELQVPFFGSPYDTNENISDLLKACPNLKVLEITGTRLDLDEIDVDSHLNLEYVNLWSENAAVSSASSTLAFLQKFPKLKALGLETLLMFDDKDLMNVVSDMDLEFISTDYDPTVSRWGEIVRKGTRIDMYGAVLGRHLPTGCRAMVDCSPPLVTHPDMAEFLERIISE